ncbi:MAG: hypothetical protein PVI21_01685 [Candidatus Woesebacteria bacterium]|jgi:hypothetical protein
MASESTKNVGSCLIVGIVGTGALGFVGWLLYKLFVWLFVPFSLTSILIAIGAICFILVLVFFVYPVLSIALRGR